MHFVHQYQIAKTEKVVGRKKPLPSHHVFEVYKINDIIRLEMLTLMNWSAANENTNKFVRDKIVRICLTIVKCDRSCHVC